MEFHLKFLAIFPFGQTAFCFVAAALGQYQVWLPHGESAAGSGLVKGEGSLDRSVLGVKTAQIGLGSAWAQQARELGIFRCVEVTAASLWQKL